jgi:hypothetical protein
MMRQSQTNIHPAKESKGNGRQNQDPDEAGQPLRLDATRSLLARLPRRAPRQN